VEEVPIDVMSKPAITARMKSRLPLYVGEGGVFERTFCCYGNDVDCGRCGAYAVVQRRPPPTESNAGRYGWVTGPSPDMAASMISSKPAGSA
jgi:hypothetical protein